eukprot:4592410-Karenia_brevis.AAC.1
MASSQGQATCDLCPGGKYQSAAGSSRCTACEAGSSASTPSTDSASCVSQVVKAAEVPQHALLVCQADSSE